MAIARDTVAVLGEKARYARLVISNPKYYDFNGVRLPLHATAELQRIRRAVYRGDYESPEIAAVKALIRPDDIVLELGAGCGVVSAFIAKSLADSGNLHAFEANPALVESIQAVAAANRVAPNVVNAAVGREDGETNIYLDQDFLSSSLIDRGRGARQAQIRMTSFAGLLARLRPTVVVFDVEGAEQQMFDTPLPKYVRVLCGELHAHIMGDHGVSNVIRAIMNQGFDLVTEHSRGRGFAFMRHDSA